MSIKIHQPFTDDGVTYCGWDGHEGCGEVWPCSTIRAQGLREGAASETGVETGPELHPRNSIALGSESMPNTKSVERLKDRIDDLRAQEPVMGTTEWVIKTQGSLVRRMRASLREQDAEIADLKATIDRLWAQLNEATNVPDHNDPEFGFDKTAALSEPDEGHICPDCTP